MIAKLIIGIVLFIVFVLIMAEIIASIIRRMYLNRKRNDGLGKVSRRSKYL